MLKFQFKFLTEFCLNKYYYTEPQKYMFDFDKRAKGNDNRDRIARINVSSVQVDKNTFIVMIAPQNNFSIVIPQPS